MRMARPFRYLWKDFLAGRIDDETLSLKELSASHWVLLPSETLTSCQLR
jgi:hypothetical protein